MNKRFKSIIPILSIVSIFLFPCLVLNALKIKGNAIQGKKWQKDTTIVLKNGIYQLELQTIFFDGTLSDEWVEYGFIAPLILDQYLIFYKNGEMIKKYPIPIKKVRKENNKHKKVTLASIPVFDICLLKGDNIDVYSVYGANYCFGLGCPEFMGLYSMEGKMISECISAKKYFSGENMNAFLEKHKINVNKPVARNSIFDIFKIRE